MKHKLTLAFIAILIGSLLGLSGISTMTWAHNSSERKGPYEVWIMDQSDTRPDGGGTLYIYDGEKLEGSKPQKAKPEVIDLGGAARDFCLAQTGSAPRRPHMLFFNDEQTHAIISFVTTGHVLFLDAKKRTLVGVVDVGAQAHAAVPSPDGTFVIVADQGGKKMHRIRTDFSTNTFTLETAATLDLATCTTPNGAPCQDAVLRPDNAPICPDFDEEGRFSFVTLRGGGLFVVDTTSTPMSIVAEYDKDTIHPNGCGGVHLDGKMYIDAGGGTAANPLESDLYTFPLDAFSSTPNPPNTPAPQIVFSNDGQGFVDSHGMVLTKKDRHLWVADRAANRIVVVDTDTDLVVNEINLVGPLSSDPTPDLLDRSPNGNRVFMALRGPVPLTGNAPGVNNAVGSTPGLGVVRVEQGGRHGVLEAIVPISNIVNGVQLADPHGIAVRVKRAQGHSTSHLED
jgi:DNA-binding beta-propeller fold protein YncE